MEPHSELEHKRGIVRDAFTYEAFIAYYVLSGLIKSVLYNLPFDLTVLMMGLIVLTIIKDWLYKKNFLKVRNDTALLIFLFFIFYIWIAFTLIYTPSPNYAYEKVLKSLTNIVFVLIILKGDFDTSKFLKISYILIVILLAWFIPLRFLYISGHAPKGYWFTRNIMGLYLHLSMPLGMLLLFYFTSHYTFSNNRLVNSIFYGIGIVALLLLGARGPILIFALIYFVYLLIHGKLKLIISKKKLIYSILSMLILLLLIFVFSDEVLSLFNTSLDRIKLIFNGFGSPNKDFGESINGRLVLISQAFKIIFSSFSNFLFGAGIGSFGILTIGKDIRYYPHNFILEIWSELGLIGLIIFLLIVFFSIRKVRISFNDLNIFPVLYILLNFLKSGSLADMRILFTILAIYFVATISPERK